MVVRYPSHSYSLKIQIPLGMIPSSHKPSATDLATPIQNSIPTPSPASITPSKLSPNRPLAMLAKEPIRSGSTRSTNGAGLSRDARTEA